jgi:hypothetical protein
LLAPIHTDPHGSTPTSRDIVERFHAIMRSKEPLLMNVARKRVVGYRSLGSEVSDWMGKRTLDFGQ